MHDEYSYTHRPYFEARVPTNIALLKYWGKRDAASQWPANDSLSLSLSALATTTRVQTSHAVNDHSFVLQGRRWGRQDSFATKAFAHLDRLASMFGFTDKLAITSDNSFPTGCGIASSASGIGALTLAALAAWTQAASLQELDARGWTLEKLAHLARLGSGSACRSFWGGVVKWEKGPTSENQRVYPVFGPNHWNLADTVVIFPDSPKKVSSSSAHQDAWTSPLFLPRLAGLEERAECMLTAIAHKDMASLGPLIEQEAIEMHAVMMSATPATFYFGKETASFLAWLRQIRQREGFALYFTLDAGPNVHIIGERDEQKKLRPFLQEYYPTYRTLYDEVGLGPTLQVKEPGV